MTVSQLSLFGIVIKLFLSLSSPHLSL